jgi:hypothetical protein
MSWQLRPAGPFGLSNAFQWFFQCFLCKNQTSPTTLGKAEIKGFCEILA